MKKNPHNNITLPIQDIVISVIALGDQKNNLEHLSTLTAALHQHTLASDAYKDIGSTLYSLDEYIDLLRTKQEGKTINEEYLEELRKDLLDGRL